MILRIYNLIDLITTKIFVWVICFGKFEKINLLHFKLKDLYIPVGTPQSLNHIQTSFNILFYHS